MLRRQRFPSELRSISISEIRVESLAGNEFKWGKKVKIIPRKGKWMSWSHNPHPNEVTMSDYFSGIMSDKLFSNFWPFSASIRPLAVISAQAISRALKATASSSLGRDSTRFSEIFVHDLSSARMWREISPSMKSFPFPPFSLINHNRYLSPLLVFFLLKSNRKHVRICKATNRPTKLPFKREEMTLNGCGVLIFPVSAEKSLGH
jgi:hypothetical protein